MHLASSSSATNLPDTAAAATLLPAAAAAGRPNADNTSSSNTAVVRPMRSQSQSAVITIEQPQQRPQARSASATSYTSEESEESVPDSLEEGRAPLLRRPQSLSDELEQGRSVGSGEEQQQQQEPGKTSRRRIPKERIKTVHALLLLAFAGFLNDLVLSYIHELVPDTDPLPDFAFHHLPYWAQALVVSEYLMIGSFCVMFLIAFSHKYRWVVFRRIFVIGSLLYLGRCVTMFVTQVPKADPNYYCSPKLQPEERTFWAIFSRALSVLFGLGLSINGRHTLCGDYIYSGHTVVHILCYMFICEYSPRRWLPLHWLSFCASSVGVLSLLVSRGHYSIDILVAYWITTRVFWLYHTLADLPALRNDLQGRNKMTKTIWYRLFLYMEGAVQRPVPRKYEIPFTVPPRLLRWWQRRQSGSGGGGGAADPNRDRLIAE